MSGEAGLVVIGASHAGVQVAASVRDLGFTGAITLIGDEADVPYQRPPLSKGYLTGKTAEAMLPLRGATFFEERQIDLRLGARATAVDLAARTVTLADGVVLPWQRLAFATGTRPRALPCVPPGTRGVLALRTLQDARDLRGAWQARHIVIAGAGYIGLEVAAALAEEQRQVTVIEAQSRILSRTTPAPVAQWMSELHASRGVTLATSTTIASVQVDGGAVRSVTCSDGRVLPADLLVVGIGVVANDDIARAAGIACEDGILVDELARTSHPDVVAAGDCTRHYSAHAGRQVRLESIQNAADQARTAAATLVGQSQPYRAVPWFWTDQFGFKLQTAGIAGDASQSVLRGDLADGRGSWFHFSGGRLVAVDSINKPAEHMLARKLLAAGAAVTPAQAADTGFDLGSVLS